MQQQVCISVKVTRAKTNSVVCDGLEEINEMKRKSHLSVFKKKIQKVWFDSMVYISTK